VVCDLPTQLRLIRLADLQDVIGGALLRFPQIVCVWRMQPRVTTGTEAASAGIAPLLVDFWLWFGGRLIVRASTPARQALLAGELRISKIAAPFQRLRPTALTS
jgi:hypothetical protein